MCLVVLKTSACVVARARGVERTVENDGNVHDGGEEKEKRCEGVTS